jgi:hypothetical protein
MSLPADLNAKQNAMYVEDADGNVATRTTRSGLIARSQSQVGMDTGVLNTTSNSFNISEYRKFSVQVVTLTGTITGLINTLEYSNDGTTWWASATTIAAAILSDNIESNAKYVRLKATTKSTLASTANIYIQGK